MTNFDLNVRENPRINKNSQWHLKANERHCCNMTSKVLSNPNNTNLSSTEIPTSMLGK